MRICSDGRIRERDFQCLPPPNLRSSNRSFSLTLASLPSKALETPESLMLETSI
jgi:hypothetical protein